MARELKVWINCLVHVNCYAHNYGDSFACPVIPEKMQNTRNNSMLKTNEAYIQGSSQTSDQPAKVDRDTREDFDIIVKLPLVPLPLPPFRFCVARQCWHILRVRYTTRHHHHHPYQISACLCHPCQSSTSPPRPHHAHEMHTCFVPIFFLFTFSFYY